MPEIGVETTSSPFAEELFQLRFEHLLVHDADVPRGHAGGDATGRLTFQAEPPWLA